HLLAEIPTEEQGESGLLGMELHPDFPETPYVYFLQSYSEGGEIANRLLRYSFEAGALRNREVIIDGILGNTYHDGARLAFGPSGYLYVTTGDAGRPRVAQDTEALNGKVLRVTADGEPAPAGADFYDSGLIPGWRGSFLFVTLKGSALYRLELSEDGGGVESQTIISQGRYGRLRDVLVNPDGVVYIATSNRDGRGDPAANDDRILMIRPEE
ncbi:MAG: PQQ-dependent sugar dehydrogenase, partial [Spirochaetaceae bacterium]